MVDKEAPRTQNRWLSEGFIVVVYNSVIKRTKREVIVFFKYFR